MRVLIPYLLKVLACWMLLFLLQQAAFLYFEPIKLGAIVGAEIITAFRRALPMNLAAACYLTLPVALLSMARMVTDARWPVRALRAWLGIAVVGTVIIHVSDIGLFQSWGTKVNHKALSYLVYPKQALAAASGAQPGQLVVIAVAQAAITWFLLSRFRHDPPLRQSPLWSRVVAVPMVTGLLLIGSRGGVQDDPINRSWSYHCAHPVLNHSAVNGVWNVIVLLAEPPEIEENPYAFMPQEEAERLFADLHARRQGPAHRLSANARPNVLLVLLESWTADVIGPLGGEPDVTPGFTRLCNEGLLFTEFYSTGFRTEQGLCAVISGFPSQPKTTIIRQYGKFEQLPSLVSELDSAGYASTYWYAGDVVFANTRSYLEAMGFDTIHDERSFPVQRRTEWGAYDEELFAFHARRARTAREPFFHTVMTSTSHEPFDAPLDEGFPGSDYAQRYRNSVHYTDRTLAAFIDSCKAQPWWDRTLVLIMADHGHFLPKHRGNHEAERHRIPFLISGGALLDEFKGNQIAVPGSHVDIASTVLHQLGLASERFPWSKDLFDPSATHFAYWTFDDGFGIADQRQSLVYDNLGRRRLQLRDSSASEQVNAELEFRGKALEQVLLDRYIRLSQ